MNFERLLPRSKKYKAQILARDLRKASTRCHFTGDSNDLKEATSALEIFLKNNLTKDHFQTFGKALFAYLILTPSDEVKDRQTLRWWELQLKRLHTDLQTAISNGAHSNIRRQFNLVQEHYELYFSNPLRIINEIRDRHSEITGESLDI